MALQGVITNLSRPERLRFNHYIRCHKAHFVTKILDLLGIYCKKPDQIPKLQLFPTFSPSDALGNRRNASVRDTVIESVGKLLQALL